ncbi:MAG TPA: UDP-N-acetylmuramoyl-L-alanine--D-glutamate ligase, partial [Bryobacteraceae bacterium]
MNLENAEVLVIGIKRSGQAAAELLQKKGARVRLMDEGTPGDNEQIFLDTHKLTLENQDEANIGSPEVIVVSPGVPVDIPLLVHARARGIPVIGEVELASFYLKGPVIGITGSNGKTTTTALTGHILRQCGIECLVGGNIGTAVTSLVDGSRDGQWNVLELSSFQLETVFHFRAEVAACLNVTPDHLDRHHTFEDYANAKARLFETQVKGDNAVLNFEDETCREFASRTKAEVFWFSSKRKVPCGVHLEGDEILLNGNPFMERRQIGLRGMHNVENAMAAAMMARLAGASPSLIGDAVRSFPGVEHRIEFVRSLKGVDYYNDSKATNVDAALKALDAFDGDLWVILGGKDKGSDYRPLREPLRQKAKAALLIGAAANRIAEDLEGAVKLVRPEVLREAVWHAKEA